MPYVTAGVGGLSLFEKASLGINGTETFFTSNVGGGVNWYAGRWGLRGDYRFIAVQSKDDAPDFFGRENRYGHRIYGGVLLNVDTVTPSNSQGSSLNSHRSRWTVGELRLAES